MLKILRPVGVFFNKSLAESADNVADGGYLAPILTIHKQSNVCLSSPS
jgi:hypothetical protein